MGDCREHNKKGDSTMTEITQTTSENQMIIGGEKVAAKDEYLHTITNLFFKINAAADGITDMGTLRWKLDYYTMTLINSVLDPDDRDNLKTAKESIYQAECIKRATKPVRTLQDLTTSVSQDARNEAMIYACTTITGEIRNYLDRYFGFEQKLAVML